MIPKDHKLYICELLDDALQRGVRTSAACDALNIHPRTYKRWKENQEDKRKSSKKSNRKALSTEERQQIIDVCTSAEYCDVTPPEIVARLAEKGTYIASSRTFYRVLKAAGKLHHRGNSRPPRTPYKPPELKATAPDQVYTWDITWLPTYVKGVFWYCYAIIDVWSREIVGWSIHDSESEEFARQLFSQLQSKRKLKGVWVHSDNGNPMKGATFSVWLATLGMFLSHSRPLVKNDNPYIESFFKTLKYHAAYPGRFNTIHQAREWMADFINWYNTQHRHSGIGYVTPQQRREGDDKKLFTLRNETLDEAWKRVPQRFPKKGPKKWKSNRVVYLNPSADTRKFIMQKQTA